MKSLHKPEVWQKILDESEEAPVILLKHSNTCPISADAFAEVKALEKKRSIEESMYILIVQNAREISNLVEEDLGVKHESPQVFVIRNGEAVYHESHQAIDADELVQAVADAR